MSIEGSLDDLEGVFFTIGRVAFGGPPDRAACGATDPELWRGSSAAAPALVLVPGADCTGAGSSLTISAAGLSWRSPLKDGCRSLPSPVHSPKATSATSSGF